MDVAVLSEPLTYERHSPHSYFKDLIASDGGENAATARLARHERELAVELERRDQKARAQKPDDVEYRTMPLEQRATPSRAPGQGGSFAPPLWLIDAFATAPRAPRVLAAEMPQFPLPSGIQSVNVPRLTTGTHTQPVADASADPSRDIVDAATTSPVITISGHGDVALQLLEQSPAGAHLDWAYFKDLTESYDGQLEAQLINGSAANGQLAGLLSFVTGANAVTYTDGSPTATRMFTYFGQVVAAIGNNRRLPPEMWLMTTSRLGWLGSSEDQQQRPLMITDRDGSGDFDLLTFGGRMDNAVPTNLGTGQNQDAIIACRPSDGLLFESEPRIGVHLEVLSGTLQARLQLHRYVAAINGRQPAGIAALQGTGMVVQSGF